MYSSHTPFLNVFTSYQSTKPVRGGIKFDAFPCFCFGWQENNLCLIKLFPQFETWIVKLFSQFQTWIVKLFSQFQTWIVKLFSQFETWKVKLFSQFQTWIVKLFPPNWDQDRRTVSPNFRPWFKYSFPQFQSHLWILRTWWSTWTMAALFITWGINPLSPLTENYSFLLISPRFGFNFYCSLLTVYSRKVSLW